MLAGTPIPDCYRQVALSGVPWQTQQFEYRDERVSGAFEVFAFQTASREMAALFMDVTERMQTEQALRDSEARMQSIFRSAPTGIGMVRDRIIIAANDHLCEITGYARGELLNQSARMLYPTDEDFEFVGREKYDQIKHFGVGTVETRWRRRDGEIIDVLLSSCPIDQADWARGVTFSALDITSRKRAETALRDSEARLRAIFEAAANVSFIVTDARAAHPNVLEFSPGAERIFGYRRTEMVGRSAAPLYLAQDSARFAEAHRRMREGGRGFSGEATLVRKNGERFPALYTTYPLLDSDGRMFASLAVAIDIGEQKRAEESLRESQAMLQAVLDAIPVCVFWKDRNLNFLGCNARFARDAGVGASERIVGKSDFDLSWKAQAERYRADDRAVIESGLPRLRYEEPQELPDKGMLWLRTSKMPLTNSRGEIIGILGAYEDITEEKRAEEELARYRNELELLVEERTQELRKAQEELVLRERLAALGRLTATVSHELRNPLGTLRGSLLLIDDATRGKGLGLERVLDRAERNILRCDAIIEELLDFARGATLSREGTELDPWLAGAFEEISIPAPIEKAFDFRSGAFVEIDRQRMLRCLINVVNNACEAMLGESPILPNGRHGEPPAPAMRLTVSSAIRAGRIEICVADTGPGIAPEHMERLFEPLFSTKSFGVGLGLAIVRKIMEQHDGGIDIRSEPKKGTTVVLWLPLWE
ncbi:MAG: Sensor protein ZraS [candidate division BRC1 bacterium ADurb.BinA364]|nr:MAG: Sensor protein ZraS [candidate division BRC1 bacterium ADurb.BinA364]